MEFLVQTQQQIHFLLEIVNQLFQIVEEQYRALRVLIGYQKEY